MSETKKSLNKIVSDLTLPLKKSKGFFIWVGFLLTVMGWGAFAYFTQLRDGLGATALTDYISWGLYISTFIFFVATALIGMLMSAVLGLIGIKWITPIARIAEMIAVGFAMWAGLVIILDMGRPDRLLNVFLYGRFQSPILWDLTVVTTYTVISIILFLLPMIPDTAFLKKTMTDQPKWKQKIYSLISFGWKGTEEQYKIIKRSIRTLSILIVPVALAIHTVTSWLFAMTPRVGWDSTIFGPYYVTGAFAAGTGAVVVLMFIIRKSYKLSEYLTDFHFDKMGKLLVLMLLVYLYFNINEYIVPGYKMKRGDDHHLFSLFAGKNAVLFWSVQIFGLVLPIILLLLKPMRKPFPLFVLGAMVVLGGFFKRYIITVPTLEHPFLPADNVPAEYMVYWPNWVEWGVTGFALAGAVLVISILAKLFPVMPIWEVAHEEGISEKEMNDYKV